ncbi:MAG: hypothetical protein RL341_840 [Pseudomonadota bacterium]|jgi:uncharacterized protein (DUF1330 family)
MPAYIIADVTVTDPVQYEEYKKFSTAAMQAHGAVVRVRGGKTIKLEGREPGRTVVLEFPTLAAAQAFYDSPEYVKARKARDGAAVMNMFVVEGL